MDKASGLVDRFAEGLFAAQNGAVTLVVGLITVMGVAATIYLNNRIVHRQIKSAHALKIAEMRQIWISNLRDAMATFQSYSITAAGDYRSNPTYLKKGTEIELLMNPNDPDYIAMRSILDKFYDADTQSERSSIDKEFVRLSQNILKREWERLKSDVDKASR